MRTQQLLKCWNALRSKARCVRATSKRVTGQPSTGWWIGLRKRRHSNFFGTPVDSLFTIAIAFQKIYDLIERVFPEAHAGNRRRNRSTSNGPARRHSNDWVVATPGDSPRFGAQFPSRMPRHGVVANAIPAGLSRSTLKQATAASRAPRSHLPIGVGACVRRTTRRIVFDAWRHSIPSFAIANARNACSDFDTASKPSCRRRKRKYGYYVLPLPRTRSPGRQNRSAPRSRRRKINRRSSVVERGTKPTRCVSVS